MNDLEDDIELPQDVVTVERPRKLSRLKKSAAANKSSTSPYGIDTPEGEQTRSSLAGVLADRAENEDLKTSPVSKDLNQPAAMLADAEDEEEEAEASSDEEQEEEDGGGEEEDQEEEIDEEEELEDYYRRKANGEAVEEEEDPAAAGHGSDSDDDAADADYDAPANLGPNATLEDLNAETQRILRETAARDRLGKGQRIEVRPLTGIVAKLKERRALAISRAPKPRVADVPSFDDILAAATAGTGGDAAEVETTAPTADDAKDGDNDNNANAASTPVVKKTVADFFAAHHSKEKENDDAVDLDIVSDGDDEEVVVDLPNTAHRATAVGFGAALGPEVSPLAMLPFTQSGGLDEFEEEAPLIDDGANSDDESDSESERSWEIRRDENAGGKEGDEAENGDGAESKGNASSSDSESDSDVDDDEDVAGDGMKQDAADLSNGSGAAAGASDLDAGVGGTDAAAGAEAPPAKNAVEMLMAADAIPRVFKRVQRKFIDTEAELSDEEGRGAMVSDDEDEDDVNDNGELADLVTADKGIKKQDKDAVDELHLRWARQNDAKELQQVLRGLENGFRRQRPGFMDGDGAELDGRRRRARLDGDDDDEGGFGHLLWPGAMFGTGGGTGGEGGDDEECEDEAMLHKAKQQRLLAASQGTRGGPLSPGAVPLDEDSQMVLGYLHRSESQQYNMGPPLQTGDGSGGGAGAGNAAGVLARGGSAPSRLAMELLGSEPTASLMRAPSFVGRQTAAVRTHGTGSLGMGGGRSFVFGRGENSNPAFGMTDGAGGSGNGSGNGGGSGVVQGSQGSGSEPTGPTTFANLRQMTGAPTNNNNNNTSAGSGAGASAKSKGKKRGRGGPTLVSRLKNGRGGNGSQSQESVDAMNAMWHQVALGGGKKK